MSPGPESLTFVHQAAEEPPDGPAVALTPIAVEQLNAASVQPWVIDDLVDRRLLLADWRSYTAWKLDWLNRVDAAVQGRGSVRAAACWITTPLDSVVMAARLLRAAAEAVGPTKIHYIGVGGPEEVDPIHDGHMQFRPLLGDVPLAARLLPLVATRLGVPFEIQPTQRPEVASASSSSLRQRVLPTAARFRNTWRPTAGANQGTTLMLWSAGYGARRFARGERERGRRIALLQRGNPTCVLVPSWRGFRSVGLRVPTDLGRTSPTNPCDDLDELLHEIDEWAQLPGAGSELKSRLMAFTQRVTPVIDKIADALVPQLTAAGVDELVAANPHAVEEFGVLLAAHRHGRVNRTLLQHGDHLMPYDGWLVTEVHNFDELWTSDATVVSDLERAATTYSQRAPRVRVRSPRVEELAARSRHDRSRAPDRPEAIGYVPAMFVGDSYVIGGGYFDDAWYHRWHLQLLDWMELQPDRRFVWKALPGSDQAEDPIPQVLRRRGTTNVIYETRPFRAVADGFTRVFFDFPSSALYEAVHLGLPVLAVVFPRFAELRSSAVERFGSTVRECDDEASALDHLSHFVDAPAGDYVVDPARILMTEDSGTRPRESPPIVTPPRRWRR